MKDNEGSAEKSNNCNSSGSNEMFHEGQLNSSQSLNRKVGWGRSYQVEDIYHLHRNSRISVPRPDRFDEKKTASRLQHFFQRVLLLHRFEIRRYSKKLFQGKLSQSQQEYRRLYHCL